MEEQITNTPWNVFDRIQYKDDSTTQYEFVYYKERNVSILNLSEYNMINQDLDVALMIPDSFLHVQCQIQNAAGNSINNGKIAFNNNGFNVFYRAQYFMNDQLIEDIEDVGVATTVNGLINYSRAYSDSMNGENWVLDTGYAGNNTNLYQNVYIVVPAAGAVPSYTATITGTTAAGLPIVTIDPTAAAAGIAVANAASVQLYINGNQITVARFTGAATQTVVIPIPPAGAPIVALTAIAAVPPAVVATTGTLSITGAAQYDIYRLFQSNGAEVTIWTGALPTATNANFFFFVCLMGNLLIGKGKLKVEKAAWYQKDHVTFSDLLRAVRVEVWRDSLISQKAKISPSEKNIPSEMAQWAEFIVRRVLQAA